MYNSSFFCVSSTDCSSFKSSFRVISVSFLSKIKHLPLKLRDLPNLGFMSFGQGIYPTKSWKSILGQIQAFKILTCFYFYATLILFHQFSVVELIFDLKIKILCYWCLPLPLRFFDASRRGRPYCLIFDLIPQYFNKVWR